MPQQGRGLELVLELAQQVGLVDCWVPEQVLARALVWQAQASRVLVSVLAWAQVWRVQACWVLALPELVWVPAWPEPQAGWQGRGA